MCEMMLNTYKGQAFRCCPGSRITAGKIIRMQVTGQDLRPAVKQIFKIADLLLIKIQCFGVFQIADMLT